METRLFGTDGGIHQFNIDEGYIMDAELYLEKDGGQFDMKIRHPAPAAANSMHHFVDCIINDIPHMATGEEGVIIMKVLDAIYKSAETGSPVAIS